MVGVASTKTDFEPATADTSPLIARARTDAAGPRSVIGMAEQLSWLGIALMVIICVHLLRCFGRRLRQGRGARCRAGGKKTYRHGPVSGKLFSGYFLEIFLRIKHGPKGLRRCLHQTEDVLAVLRQLALPDAVDPEQTLRCGGAGLRDRLQGQVREHDVRRHLLLRGALHPPLAESLEQGFVVRRRAVRAPADLALGRRTEGLAAGAAVRDALARRTGPSPADLLDVGRHLRSQPRQEPRRLAAGSSAGC